MNLNTRFLRLFCLFYVALSFCPDGYCQTYFVDSIASGDGTTWNKAFSTLQEALDVANSGDEIWVAKGTYYPQKDILGNTPADPRTKTFYISRDIKIYGGFQGTENQRSERDPILHPTILSGDIGMANDTSDNTYHVVYFSEVSRDCVLSGFTIEQGNAGGTFGSADGAGVYIDAVDKTTSPTITRCVISNNYAHGNGGAVKVLAVNAVAAPLFHRVLFKNNYAFHSGAVECNASGTGINSASFVNCIFCGNHANSSGGAFVSNTSSGGVANNNLLFCTFTKNSADLFGSAIRMLISGGGGANTAIVKNCIFFDNTELVNSVDIFKEAAANLDIDFCSTEGSDCADLVNTSNFVCGPSMIYNVDPLFLDPFCCNVELTAGSPAIGMGDAHVFEGEKIGVDYLGNLRAEVDDDYDIGAHEFYPELGDPYILVQNESLELFECPGDDKYFLTGELSQFVFFLDDVNGTNLEKINACGRYVLDLSMYNPGTYFIRAEHNSISELDIQLMVEVD